MPVTDEIITIWRQQGVAQFRNDLRLNMQQAQQSEKALAALAVQMERISNIKPHRPLPAIAPMPSQVLPRAVAGRSIAPERVASLPQRRQFGAVRPLPAIAQPPSFEGSALGAAQFSRELTAISQKAQRGARAVLELVTQGEKLGKLNFAIAPPMPRQSLPQRRVFGAPTVTQAPVAGMTQSPDMRSNIAAASQYDKVLNSLGAQMNRIKNIRPFSGSSQGAAKFKSDLTGITLKARQGAQAVSDLVAQGKRLGAIHVNAGVTEGLGNFRLQLRANRYELQQNDAAMKAVIADMNRMGRMRPPRQNAPMGGTVTIPRIPNTIGITRTTTAVNSLGSSLMQLAGSVGGLYAVRQAIGYITDSAGKVELATVAFKTLLGSTEAANKMVADLQTFAKNTPYNFMGSLKAAQQLKAMGFNAQELIPVMTTLGDSVAAIGGDSDVFARVAYNMGQIKTQGHAMMLDIRQFAMAGLNVVDIMKAATGQVMTLSQITEIPATKLIPELLSGMNKLYGGTMKKAGNTIPQALSNMTDSFEQLAAVVGHDLNPVFVTFAHGATAVANGLKSIASNSSAAGIGMGVITAGAGAVGIRQIFKAIGARKNLTMQVLQDVAAERTKAGVAGEEALAIGKGTETVIEATAARKGFVGAMERAGLAVARAKGWMGSAFEVGGTSFQSPFADAFGGRMIGGQMFARGGARTLGLMTNAGMATGAALGGIAGFQSYDNWKKAGMATGEAAALATTTGISAGLISMFVPGGAVAVAAGEGFTALFNKLYNEPLERKAVNDNPTAITPETKGMTPEQRAEYYRKKGLQELAKGPSIWDRIANNPFMRQGDLTPGNNNNPAAMENFRRSRLIIEQARQKRGNDQLKADAAEQAARDAAERKAAERKAFEDRLHSPSSSFAAGPEARKQRNSDWIIRLPASPADKSYEQRRYNRHTPMPSLARG